MNEYCGLPAGVEAAVNALPPSILARSGKVFYTGRQAFQRPCGLYILGLNPGGDPVVQGAETMAGDLAAFRSRTDAWSAYADESWGDARPGTDRMQHRVLHFLNRLGLDPRGTPASNVVFVRSRCENDLKTEKGALLAACWPVHQAVIDALQVRVVACFGKTAGQWVRQQLKAERPLDRFTETNGRGWTSETHGTADGRVVVTLTHPSRADWRNPKADPSILVHRALREPVKHLAA